MTAETVPKRGQTRGELEASVDKAPITQSRIPVPIRIIDSELSLDLLRFPKPDTHGFLDKLSCALSKYDIAVERGDSVQPIISEIQEKAEALVKELDPGKQGMFEELYGRFISSKSIPEADAILKVAKGFGTDEEVMSLFLAKFMATAAESDKKKFAQTAVILGTTGALSGIPGGPLGVLFGAGGGVLGAVLMRLFVEKKAEARTLSDMQSEAQGAFDDLVAAMQKDSWRVKWVAKRADQAAQQLEKMAKEMVKSGSFIPSQAYFSRNFAAKLRSIAELAVQDVKFGDSRVQAQLASIENLLRSRTDEVAQSGLIG